MEGASRSPTPGAGDSPASVQTRAPFGLAMGIVAGLALLTIALSPVRDVDAFWHILIGDEIQSGGSLRGLGASWTMWPEAADASWSSTQWLSEVLFASLYAIAKWQALALFTVATSALALFLVAHNTTRDVPTIAAIWPFTIATASLVAAANDRPQQFSLIGAAWLGGVLMTGIRSRILPPWWLVTVATAVWANLHGGWILAPAVLLLLVLHGLLDDNHAQDRLAARALLLTALATLAGMLTPIGWFNVTAVLRFTRGCLVEQRVATC